MRKGLIVLIVIVGVGLITYMWWQSTYNGLVQKDEGVKAQLGQLNNAYQQRADLIPNLVQIVQGAAIAERTTLDEVISARSRATSIQLTPEALKDPQAVQKFQAAQSQLTGALSRLMVTVERYPQLQSQQNFTVLMAQLEGQENRIRVERNRYNDVTRTYNSSVRSFPTSIIAGSQFPAYPYFEAAEGAENAPKVNFNGLGPASGGTNAGAPAPASSATPESAPAQRGPARPAPAH